PGFGLVMVKAADVRNRRAVTRAMGSSLRQKVQTSRLRRQGLHDERTVARPSAIGKQTQPPLAPKDPLNFRRDTGERVRGAFVDQGELGFERRAGIAQGFFGQRAERLAVPERGKMRRRNFQLHAMPDWLSVEFGGDLNFTSKHLLIVNARIERLPKTVQFTVDE